MQRRACREYRCGHGQCVEAMASLASRSPEWTCPFFAQAVRLKSIEWKLIMGVSRRLFTKSSAGRRAATRARVSIAEARERWRSVQRAARCVGVRQGPGNAFQETEGAWSEGRIVSWSVRSAAVAGDRFLRVLAAHRGATICRY